MQAETSLCRDSCICTKAVQSAGVAAVTSAFYLGWSESNHRFLIQAEKMKIPLQGHFGRHDTFFPVKVSCCKPAQTQKFALHAETQACLRFLQRHKSVSSPSLPAASIDPALNFCQ